MEIIKEFGLNPILLIAQIVNFTILLLLLKKFLYKPVLKVLDERKKTIAQSLKNATEIEEKLQKTAQEQEKLLEKAKSEADNLIKEAKSEAKALSEKTLASAANQVSEMMEKNKIELNLEREQMINRAKKDLAEIVVAASLKIAQKTVAADDNKKMVKEALEEINR